MSYVSPSAEVNERRPRPALAVQPHHTRDFQWIGFLRCGSFCKSSEGTRDIEQRQRHIIEAFWRIDAQRLAQAMRRRHAEFPGVNEGE